MFSHFRESFKKKKVKETAVTISGPVGVSDLQIDGAERNYGFRGSNSEYGYCIVLFVNQLITLVSERKSADKIYKSRYKNLAYLAFISELFFSGEKMEIINMETDRFFEFDLEKLHFSSLNSITATVIDDFLEGKEFERSIKKQYFSKDSGEFYSIRTMDWVIFREEINEIIFQILSLQKSQIERLVQEGNDKIENPKEFVESIMFHQTKLREIIAQSETYEEYIRQLGNSKKVFASSSNHNFFTPNVVTETMKTSSGSEKNNTEAQRLIPWQHKYKESQIYRAGADDLPVINAAEMQGILPSSPKL